MHALSRTLSIVAVFLAGFLASAVVYAQDQTKKPKVRQSQPAAAETKQLQSAKKQNRPRRRKKRGPDIAERLPVKETVEADVSTRSVAVTSAFSGTKIVVFGAVNASRQKAAEAGLYDIIIVVVGTSEPLVARKKSNVAGIWVNTESINFVSVPSYYTITSTRPLNEITDKKTLFENGIGFDLVGMHASKRGAGALTLQELQDYKRAVVELKKKDRLYFQDDFGVSFIGTSLFRSSIDLPANVPVGPLTARVYLFRDGKLLAGHTASVTLQREGLERFLHDFAFEYPLFYGLFAVLLAAIAGLTASALFARNRQ